MCEEIEIWLVDEFTPKEENPIGLIWRFPVKEFLLTLTAVEVPIPTERFGSTIKEILSPAVNPCAVDIETVVVIFSTFAVFCS